MHDSMREQGRGFAFANSTKSKVSWSGSSLESQKSLARVEHLGAQDRSVWWFFSSAFTWREGGRGGGEGRGEGERGMCRERKRRPNKNESNKHTGFGKARPSSPQS